MNKQDIKVNSFECVDLTDMEKPMVAVYKHPEDYPGEIVARLFDVDKATNVVMVRNDLEDLRTDIMQHLPDLVRFDRGKEDVPSLVEVWL